MQKHALVHRIGNDLHEGKAVLQDIMIKYEDVNCENKKSLVWMTGLIDTVELVNWIGGDPYNGEPRHDSRGAHAHEDFPEREDVQWT